MVVLTGAGGIGKTRLVLAVMERSRPHWRDGTAFVDLSAVTDPQRVPDAIASALGLVVQGRERPLDTARVSQSASAEPQHQLRSSALQRSYRAQFRPHGSAAQRRMRF